MIDIISMSDDKGKEEMEEVFEYQPQSFRKPVKPYYYSDDFEEPEEPTKNTYEIAIEELKDEINDMNNKIDDLTNNVTEMINMLQEIKDHLEI
jgi:TolA-binding protein